MIHVGPRSRFDDVSKGSALAISSNSYRGPCADRPKAVDARTTAVRFYAARGDQAAATRTLHPLPAAGRVGGATEASTCLILCRQLFLPAEPGGIGFEAAVV